jgi:hypothetical protein
MIIPNWHYHSLYIILLTVLATSLINSEAMSILYCPIEPILSLTSHHGISRILSLQVEVELHQKGYLIRYNLKYRTKNINGDQVQNDTVRINQLYLSYKVAKSH